MPIRPTTPFERQSLTLAHVATQKAAANRPPQKSQDDASADGDARRRRPDRPARPPQRQAPRPQGGGRGDQSGLRSRPRPAGGATGGVSAPGGTARGGGQSDRAGEGADHSLPMIATGVEFALTALSRDGRSSRRAARQGPAPACSHAGRRPRTITGPSSPCRHLNPAVGTKKLFWTPYVFAQCGAYSRGRPNGQEEDDRTAQPLANRRRSRRLASINHLIGVTRKKNAPETE
jgi:hypothetical protein